MTQQVPKSPLSQRLRLGLFRSLAWLLLFLGIVGFVALGIGAYLTATDPQEEGWFPPLFLSGLAIAILLVIRVAYRAVRIRSVAELQEQSKSRWLAFTDAPSPNTSFEQTRER